MLSQNHKYSVLERYLPLKLTCMYCLMPSERVFFAKHSPECLALCKTGSIKLLLILGAQPSSRTRRSCTVSNASKRLALLVFASLSLFTIILHPSTHSLSFLQSNCPQMSTAMVLHRPQHARRRRDVLEAMKLIGMLGLELAAATEIGRLVSKGLKFLIKRQEVSTYLVI